MSFALKRSNPYIGGMIIPGLSARKRLLPFFPAAHIPGECLLLHFLPDVCNKHQKHTACFLLYSLCCPPKERACLSLYYYYECKSLFYQVFGKGFFIRQTKSRIDTLRYNRLSSFLTKAVVFCRKVRGRPSLNGKDGLFFAQYQFV